MEMSKNFGRQNYARRLDIVQNLCEFCHFFLYDFWAKMF